MDIYVESSAVLSWLLDQNRGDDAYRALTKAEYVFTSDLTLIECDRALHRATATREIDEAKAAEMGSAVETAAARWTICAINSEIVASSRRRFPLEPVHALDAIHLATAMFVRNLAPNAFVISFDRRIRRNAEALGFRIGP